MPLELIDALSAPGNPAKPNDDAYCHAGRLAAVFDGATGIADEDLLPGGSDAAWLARLGAERLAAHAARLSGHDALRATAADVEEAYVRQRSRPPAHNYETPFASMMMVESVSDGGLDAFWFGDCAALVLRPGEEAQVVGEAFGKRAAEANAAARLAATHGINPAGATVRRPFLEAQRASRARYNTEGGPWVFGPTRHCADQVSRGAAAAPSGALVLLASDGFLALGTDYLRYDASGLVRAARDKGLAVLLDELRAIEQDDAEGVRYPRFKTSDDATAVLLRAV
ncbi:MAG: protein phosphatase 2C domain-containing protein [Caulobacteraceae bacterium]|nr:protein phosphatase 2C domain-containing protein [Caulobacteraceae bacterium]